MRCTAADLLERSTVPCPGARGRDGPRRDNPNYVTNVGSGTVAIYRSVVVEPVAALQYHPITRHWRGATSDIQRVTWDHYVQLLHNMCEEDAPGLAQALLYRGMPPARPNAWHSMGVGISVGWLQEKRRNATESLPA